MHFNPLSSLLLPGAPTSATPSAGLVGQPGVLAAGALLRCVHLSLVSEYPLTLESGHSLLSVYFKVYFVLLSWHFSLPVQVSMAACQMALL